MIYFILFYFFALLFIFRFLYSLPLSPGQTSPFFDLDRVQPLHSVEVLIRSHVPRSHHSYTPPFPACPPDLNRQSLQTSGNLYTPISGHRRCISNCQWALPDALLSSDPIHSSGCVPVAVMYTPCDFTDV